MKKARLLLLAWLLGSFSLFASEPEAPQPSAAPISIRTLDPADPDDSDLAPLVSLIGASRVVQLGEESHGDGSVFLAKARLVRFLHERMGFDVLAWEAGLFDVRDVDAAVRAGEAPPEAAAIGLYRIWSGAQEVMPVIEYIHSTQLTKRPMRMIGFDCRVSTEVARKERYPRFIFSFFDRLDPAILQEKERADFTRMSTGLVPAEYYEHPGERAYNRDVPKRLMATIDSRKGELERYYSAEEIGYTRQTLVSMLNMDRALPAFPEQGTADGYSRDAAMADNLLWYLRGPLRDQKVIVWAHNYHIMADPLYPAILQKRPYAGPMGSHLKRELGTSLYTIASLTHSGQYAYAGEKPEPVPLPAAGSIEDLLHSNGRPYQFLDFRTLPPDSVFRKPLVASFYMYEPSTADWPRIYDAVLFIDVMKPVTEITK